MADTKVSLLTPTLTADGVAADDKLYIVDTSEGVNGSSSISAGQLAVYNQRLAQLSVTHAHTMVCPPELHIPALADDDTWRFNSALSWYTESLSGTWLGEAANETAARALDGADTGAYYHNTTDGKFYKLSAGTGQTETFRGNTAAFPAAVGWVAVQNGNVIGYDLTVEGCPMWRVIPAGSALYSTSTAPVSSMSAVGSILRISNKYGSVTGALGRTDFAADECYIRISDTSKYWPSTVANCAGTSGKPIITGAFSAGLVNRNCNAVSAYIYPDAPIDPATGQKVQTVMVHTDGGITQLGWDGVNTDAAWDRTHPSGASYNYATSGCFLKDGRLAFIMGASGSPIDVFVVDRLTADGAVALTDSVLTTTTGRANAIRVASGNLSNLTATDKGFACTHSTLGLLEVELSDPKAVRIVNKDFNTGMMPKGTVLSVGCDKDSSALVGTELVTNGTFDTDLTGWTAGDAASLLSWESGKLRITNDDGSGAWAKQTITTVVGKTYVMSVDFTPGTVGAYNMNAIENAKNGNTTSTTMTFTASTTATVIYIQLAGTALGAYADFDNISVVEALPDHSVTGLGFKTTGTINRTAVASGATMTALSGFSATDYLEQPYNSALDFGTGDFCVMGWVKTAAANTGSFFARGDTAVSGTCWWFGQLNGVPYVYSSLGALTATGTIPVGSWSHVAFLRLAGVSYFYTNGVLVHSAANTQNLTNTAAIARLGQTYSAGNIFTGSLALWRISATAPTPDQIAKIYEDERKMFEPGAKVTLQGASDVVLGVSHDAPLGDLHVWQADYRNVFRGLVNHSPVAGTFTKGGSVHDQLVVEG